MIPPLEATGASPAPRALRGVIVLKMAKSDTHPKVRAMMLERLRQMGPAERLRRAVMLSEEIRRLAIAGQQARTPDASAEEVEARVDRMFLGQELWEITHPGK